MGVIESLLDAVYPTTCPVCDRIEKPAKICDKCRKKLHYIGQQRCLKCGKAMGDAVTQYCYDCERKKHIFEQGAAVWSYSEDIKDSIYRFKYKNHRIYADVYGDEIKNSIGALIRNWNADAVIPVPIHKRKRQLRGYNQAELIARAISERCEIALDCDILSRVVFTKPQKELDDGGRLKNLENAFHIEKNVVKYSKVILVDDIYTTGATIDACASVLLAAGVKQVYYVALCIGRGF